MLDASLTTAKILIVDDQDINVQLLRGILTQAGFPDLTCTTDSRAAVSLFSASEPDLVLLDLHMPHLDGFDVLDALRPLIPEGTYLPILVLTADTSTQAKRRVLSAGARDFLTKPFDATEVVLRIRNLLETRYLHLQLHTQNTLLEEKVRERTHELEEAGYEILERLALAAEYRDDDTGQHIRRVSHITARIAQVLGLPAAEVDLLRHASALHDVGKIGVPDRFLLKPGALTPEEFALMQMHTRIGAGVLTGSRFQVLRRSEEIALAHHERWDGYGYPQGLCGEEIPLAGRIVAVADIFDALTHERPYKPAWPPQEACDEIARQSGRHFDPRIVDAFLTVFRDGL